MTEIQRIRKAIFEASGMSSNDAVSDVTSLIRVLRQEQAKFDFRAHIQRQRAFSQKTFGPGQRVKGLCSHIRKELREIEKAPTDLEEWIDVIILALDGAWRAGYTADQIIEMLQAKQTKNEGRAWPDWRTVSEDKAIEHVR